VCLLLTHLFEFGKLLTHLPGPAQMKIQAVCSANDGGGRTGRIGLNVPSALPSALPLALPGNLPAQPPSGLISHTGF
jgi:hypothetical protein